MEIIWLGHAAFKIKTASGKLIYLDPYQIKKDEEKADIIVSSHTHGDHFSSRDIKKLMKDTTRVLGPKSISSSLSEFDGTGIEIGESIEIDDVVIKLIPGYTIKKATHPKSNEWAGIIVAAEGKKVYHAGDSDRIPEMKDLAGENITVAILPCGGTYTMDMDVATDCAVDIKPEILIPMHNWDKDMAIVVDLMAKKDPNIKVEILENKSLTL